MPRQVDHDVRRAQIADASLDVALAHGLAQVSVPRTARAAGVSVGLVQHYFPAKAGLLVAAFTRLTDRSDARIATIVARGEEQAETIRSMAADALRELLPLDPDRRREVIVRREFEVSALRDADLEEVAERSVARLRRRLADVVVNGLACGESSADADPDTVALDLLVAVEGVQGLTLHPAAADAAGVLEAALVRAFPGRCRRRDAVPSHRGRGAVTGG